MAEGDVSACFDAGNGFNNKLKDALSGLVKANNDRKSEIDALRGDHDQLKKDHDALPIATTLLLLLIKFSPSQQMWDSSD